MAQITKHLLRDVAFATLRNLSALRSTASAFRQTGEREYRLLQRLARTAIEFVTGSSSARHIRPCRALREFLSPQQREALLTAAIGLDNDDDKMRAQAGLSHGLAHLGELQRNRVANIAMDAIDAIDASNDSHNGLKVLVIFRLAKSLVHWREPQRERLVAAAIGLDDGHKVHAIGLAGCGTAAI